MFWNITHTFLKFVGRIQLQFSCPVYIKKIVCWIWYTVWNRLLRNILVYESQITSVRPQGTWYSCSSRNQRATHVPVKLFPDNEATTDLSTGFRSCERKSHCATSNGAVKFSGREWQKETWRERERKLQERERDARRAQASRVCAARIARNKLTCKSRAQHVRLPRTRSHKCVVRRDWPSSMYARTENYSFVRRAINLTVRRR